MKKLLLAFAFLACFVRAHAATYSSITLTFTNIPTNGCTFTIDSTTVSWTNAPLNSTTWIQTNGIAGSATNLVRRLGAQWPQYLAKQTNGTNVIIAGLGVTFGISGNYGFLVTNTTTATNRWLVDLPFDNNFETNRTNTADALIYGLGKYARTNAFPANSQAMTNFVGLTNQQVLFNKKLTNAIAKGGTNDTVAITNAPTIGGSNAYLVVVFARDVTASNVVLQSISSAYGNLGFLTNGALFGTALTNAVGTIIAPLIHTIGDEDIGDVLTITNSGAEPGIIFHNSDDEFGGAGMVFKFGGATYWSIISNTNEFAIGSESLGTLIGVNGTNVLVGAVGSLIQLAAEAHGSSYFGTLARIGTLHPTNLIGSNLLQRFVSAAGSYTSLVDGNNAGLPTGTNLVLELSGGSTISQIAGFSATIDGDEFEARFTGAITNWIVNESGSAFSTDATAANRIKTGTGGDITQTNQPAWARFRYRGSGAGGRWELKSYSR